jgi:hypothetical protein
MVQRLGIQRKCMQRSATLAAVGKGSGPLTSKRPPKMNASSPSKLLGGAQYSVPAAHKLARCCNWLNMICGHSQYRWTGRGAHAQSNKRCTAGMRRQAKSRHACSQASRKDVCIHVRTLSPDSEAQRFLCPQCWVRFKFLSLLSALFTRKSFQQRVSPVDPTMPGPNLGTAGSASADLASRMGHAVAAAAVAAAAAVLLGSSAVGKPGQGQQVQHAALPANA